MKSHRTKEESFKCSGLDPKHKDVFFAGWYAAGNEINQGEDSDWLQERLYENDFLRKDDDDDENDDN